MSTPRLLPPSSRHIITTPVRRNNTPVAIAIAARSDWSFTSRREWGLYTRSLTSCRSIEATIEEVRAFMLSHKLSAKVIVLFTIRLLAVAENSASQSIARSPNTLIVLLDGRARHQSVILRQKASGVGRGCTSPTHSLVIGCIAWQGTQFFTVTRAR